MGALGRTARRLKAGLVALFLITLGAALAPQDAQGQTGTTILTATAGDGQVTLNWTYTYVSAPGFPSSEHTYWYYDQQEDEDWKGWEIIPSSNAGTKSYTVTGLSNGTTYKFQVSPGNIVRGNPTAIYSNSNIVTATPTGSAKTITLSAASTSITEGDSGWTDVVVTVTLGEGAPAADPDLGNFSVSLVPDSRSSGTAQGSSKGASPCAMPLSPADTDWCLPDGSTISIAEGETEGTKKVRILGDTRNEPNETIKLSSSAVLPGWTPGTLTLTIVDDDTPATTVPAAPTALSAEAGNAQVTLTWTKPAGSITGYKLRYAKTGAKNSATWTVMTGSGASTVRHTVTGLDNDAEYSFMIRAVNASGDGAATDWVTATPAAPAVTAPVLTAATSTNGQIDLTWTHASASVVDQIASPVQFFYAWRVQDHSVFVAGTLYRVG